MTATRDDAVTKQQPLDTDEILARAAKHSADKRFAELCAIALDVRAAEHLAWEAVQAAMDAETAEHPAYPADLIVKARVYMRADRGSSVTEAPVREEDRRCHPEHDAGHDGLFERTVTRIAKRDGVGWHSVRTRLQAEFYAYEHAHLTVREKHNVKALQEEAEALSKSAGATLRAVLDHPASDVETLMAKLRIRVAECEPPSDHVTWRTIVEEVGRAVA